MPFNEGLSKFFDYIPVPYEIPLGENGKELHAWMLTTKKIQQTLGKEGGTEGIDDDLV